MSDDRGHVRPRSRGCAEHFATEFDKAWDAATRAHREQAARSRPYDWSAYVDTLESVRRLMDRETLSSLARCTEHLEYEPLYIVGNPRSGTSLLEQILSMHPKVANGGEMSVGLRLQEQLVEMAIMQLEAERPLDYHLQLVHQHHLVSLL